MVVYPFYPESPYYLLGKGKPEHARKALNRIHGSGDQALIDAEMTRIKGLIVSNEETKQAAQERGPLLFQCWKGTNLVRPIPLGFRTF
jgi:Sugar (and other) transporter